MSDCTNCSSPCTEVKENKAPETIPYIVHEAAIDRAERHTKRWMITSFILIGIIFAMMIGFLIYESQFETYYYDQNGEGVNIVGDENEVNPSESKSEDQTQEEGER